MNVVSSKDEPLGRVDHILGSNVKLARDNVGQHHYVPLAWIASIDEKIHLSLTAEDVERFWAGERFE